MTATPRTVLGVDPSPTEDGCTAIALRPADKYPFRGGYVGDVFYFEEWSSPSDMPALVCIEVPDANAGIYSKVRSRAGAVMRTVATAAALRERLRRYAPVLEVTAAEIRAVVCGWFPCHGKADPFIAAWFRRMGHDTKRGSALGNNHGRDAAAAALYGQLWLERAATTGLFNATYYAALPLEVE